MTRVLKLIFENTRTSKKITWTITDPKSTITQAGVASVMNALIGAEMIIIDTDTTSQNIEISDAYIYTTQKVELE